MWHLTMEEKNSSAPSDTFKITGEPQELTPLELAILDLEEQRFRYQGSKEKAILKLGLRPIQYYQYLNRLIDDPRTEEAKPALVKRLKGQRGR